MVGAYKLLTWVFREVSLLYVAAPPKRGYILINSPRGKMHGETHKLLYVSKSLANMANLVDVDSLPQKCDTSISSLSSWGLKVHAHPW